MNSIEPDENECMHDDLENGHCINCGEYIDNWYERIFGYDD